MRLFSHFRLIVAAAMLAITSFAARMLDHAIAFAFTLFKPDPPLLAGSGSWMIQPEDREPLAPSLLERLRHEKGVPRLGAARGI